MTDRHRLPEEGYPKEYTGLPSEDRRRVDLAYVAKHRHKRGFPKDFNPYDATAVENLPAFRPDRAVCAEFVDPRGTRLRVHPPTWEQHVATLGVSSFVGVSFGATHYYAELKLPSLNLLDEDGEGYGRGGYRAIDKSSLYLSCVEVSIGCLMTREELDRFCDRYLGYSVGEAYAGWRTDELARDAIKRAFEVKCEGEWILVGFEDDCCDDRSVLSAKSGSEWVVEEWEKNRC